MSAQAPSHASPRVAIRRLVDAFAERDDPYAGADRGNAIRIVAVLLSLSGLLTAIFLPFAHPTAQIGDAGWVVAAAMIAALIVAGRLVRKRGSALSFDALLAITYGGIASTAFMTWLTGGWFSPCTQLLLLWIGAGAGIHPPRRALTVVLVSVLSGFLPLAYEGWSTAGFERNAEGLIVWSLLGLLMLLLMTYVRAQRVALRSQTVSAAALARLDPLTGLGNRRAFDETLALEIERARRGAGTISVALLDLDGFKELNDRLGHMEGDRCLKQVAEALAATKRSPDHVFRWGGDEFAVILPGAAGEQAHAAVARISHLDPPIETTDGHRLTFCSGLAQLENGMTAAELLERADLDLFSRKRERPGELERV